jgi:rare lipoprotein A
MRTLLLLLLFSCSARADICSWEQFDDKGKIAANGRPFDPTALCCASRHFKLGTKLRVTDLHNGLSVIVTVTDLTAARYAARLDLSPRAFRMLNDLPLGLCEVTISAVR